jgi:hypothetical protein
LKFFYWNFFVWNSKKMRKKIKFKFLIPGINCRAPSFNFEIYLVPTKKLVVPDTIWKLFQILMSHTVYTINRLYQLTIVYRNQFMYTLGPTGPWSEHCVGTRPENRRCSALEHCCKHCATTTTTTAFLSLYLYSSWTCTAAVVRLVVSN